MHFLDINGVTLREGQRVAWATVGNRGLALGTVLSCEVVVYDSGPRRDPIVYVTRESDKRAIKLPYDEKKFVVLADPEEATEFCCDCGREMLARLTMYTAGGRPYCDECLREIEEAE